MSAFAMPFNLQHWIDEHREQLKPPVCNKQIFVQDDYIVMVVGGPNNRTDYHYNETPELFYQLEGEMILSILKCEQPQNYTTLENLKLNTDVSAQGEFIDIPIKAGEIFLLPPNVLHSPQRFEHSVGLVVEQKRATNQQDALFWFCPQCDTPLYNEQFCLANIETDLPKVFANFYDSPTHCQCKSCGNVMTKV
jgi:3-hydroxyanthranilate 3,4-dioxygenase